MGSPVIIKKVVNNCIFILQRLTVSTQSTVAAVMKTGAPRLNKSSLPVHCFFGASLVRYASLFIFGENVWRVWADESP